MINVEEFMKRLQKVINKNCISNANVFKEPDKKARCKSFKLDTNENVTLIKLTESPAFYCKKKSAEGFFVNIQTTMNKILFLYVELKSTFDVDRFDEMYHQIRYSILSSLGLFAFANPDDYIVAAIWVVIPPDKNRVISTNEARRKKMNIFKPLREIEKRLNEKNPVVKIDFGTPIKKEIPLIVSWCDENTGMAEEKLEEIVQIIEQQET